MVKEHNIRRAKEADLQQIKVLQQANHFKKVSDTQRRGEEKFTNATFSRIEWELKIILKVKKCMGQLQH